MIEINNSTAKLVQKKDIFKVAQKILEWEKVKEKNLSIALVGSKRIRVLNKRYRGKNRATDVLSFCQSPEFPIIAEGESDLGEIVICPEEVKKNAKKYKSSFKKELVRVLIHGILHLLGYEHENNVKEAEKMRKKEEYYLNQLCQNHISSPV